jgi:hypothetical protein
MPAIALLRLLGALLAEADGRPVVGPAPKARVKVKDE